MTITDKQRLDWVQANDSRAVFKTHGAGAWNWRAREYDADGFERQYQGKNLREALDAAIRAEAKAKEKAR